MSLVSLPTKGMYEEIATQMFSKYPHLAHPQQNMPIGNMKSLWKDRLMHKFRNNRKRSDHQIPEVQAKKKVKGNPVQRIPRPTEEVVRQWGMRCYLPRRPPSEDDDTIKAHEEFLVKEKKTRQPYFVRVKLAMDKTLSDRRRWLVLLQPRPKLTAVKERCPWLFDEDQMTTEMMRLQGTTLPLIDDFKAGLGKYASALVVKGQGVKKPPQCFNNSIGLISAQRVEEDRKDATCKAAMLILPKLLKGNISDIFVAPDAETQNPVHLRMDAEDILQCSMFTLFADGIPVATSEDFFDAVVMWVSAYYIFNLAYESVVKTLCFIQTIILKIKDQLPTPRSLTTLITALNQINARR